MRVHSAVKERLPAQGRCEKCGYISSMDVCKACVLLEGLNRGLPKLGIGKSSKTLATMEEIKKEDRQTKPEAVRDRKLLEF